MRRRLTNIAAGVSALLAVVVCVLWMRSYPGEKWARAGPRSLAVVTWRGSVMLERHIRTVAPCPGTTPISSRASSELDDLSLASSGWLRTEVTAGQWVPGDTRFGFADLSVTNWAKNDVGKSQMYRIERGRLRVVPFWCPFLVFLVLPGVWVYRRLTNPRRRLVEGFCRVCGYDLRATPQRCPECGALSGRSSN